MARPTTAITETEPYALSEPERRRRTWRRPIGLPAFRFAELLTRTPTPHPVRSSSWGYGFFIHPSPSSSGDCPVPTAPGIPRPRHGRSRRVHALVVPATAPYPRPLATPIPRHQFRSRSEPWQVRCLSYVLRVWRPSAASFRRPEDPNRGQCGVTSISALPRASRLPSARPRRGSCNCRSCACSTPIGC